MSAAYVFVDLRARRCYQSGILIWLTLFTFLVHAEVTRANRTGLIVNPVPGLYENLPASSVVILKNHHAVTCAEALGKDTVKISARLLSIGQGKLEAFATTQFDRSCSTMKLVEVVRRGRYNEMAAPKFVEMEGVPSLLQNRGTPTSLMLSLLCMKRAGVPYGGLRFMEATKVVNVDTLRQLKRVPRINEWLRKYPNQPVPGDFIASAFWFTTIGRITFTLLTQAGLAAESVQVDGVEVDRHSIKSFVFRVSLYPL